MKAWLWVIIASVGFAVMLGALAWRARTDYTGPWASGLIVMSQEAPGEKSWRAGVIPARLRLLSSNAVAEYLLFGTHVMAPDKALELKGQARVKLIELPLSIAGIGASQLQSGRLPEAGRSEVLAGARIEPGDTLMVGVASLKVVGVLKPGLELFADSVLIPAEAISTGATNRLFPAEVPTVLHSWLVPASAEELRDAQVRKELEEVFPREKYAWVTGTGQLEHRHFYLYLSGLAIFLLGGSGALIALFRWRSSKVTLPALAGPLLEMKARPRLVWTVHVVCFGLVMAGSLLIFQAPEAHVVLLSNAREALASNGNPLGTLGQAYRSGNMPLAAAVTFALAFLVGSLACITLPSILLPGAGMLVAGLLALAWGVILAPLTEPLALAMLPRSLTMLVGGEGLILATIFGLLIPIHVVRRSLGGNLFMRFGRVLSLNLKAQFWIALMLGFAAIYEATEVILMNR
jgi:hypothetical protein